MLSLIKLGDAYRYAGHSDRALAWHESALRIGTDTIDARYVGSTWVYNYMPIAPGDRETIKRFVQVDDLKQKQAVAVYALSFDHAVLGEFSKADSLFLRGVALENNSAFRLFFANKIEAIENSLQMQPAQQSWFQQHRLWLQAPPTLQ